MTHDLIVIGAGVMGCTIAWRAAQRGLRPLVLERSVPGAEASSAAAGILAPQQESEADGPSLRIGLASRARFADVAAELHAATGIDVGYRRSGLVATAFADEPEKQKTLIAKAGWQSRLGLAVEQLDAEGVRRHEPELAPCALGLRFADEARLEPPRLMRALQLAAARAGAEFRAAWVRRVLHDGERVLGVELDGGRVLAPRVVLAAGSWSSLVEGALSAGQAVRPLRGQMLELDAPSVRLSHVVFAAGGYLVPRGDGRIAVGSTMEHAGYARDVTVAGLGHLCSVAARALPALAAAPVVRSWANFRPTTEDHLPILGEGAIRGLLFATGHFRNGILLSAITGDIIAALAAGEPSPIDLGPFSPARLNQGPQQ